MRVQGFLTSPSGLPGGWPALDWVADSGFGVQGLDFRVQGLGFRVLGSGFRV